MRQIALEEGSSQTKCPLSRDLLDLRSLNTEATYVAQGLFGVDGVRDCK